MPNPAKAITIDATGMATMGLPGLPDVTGRRFPAPAGAGKRRPVTSGRPGKPIVAIPVASIVIALAGFGIYRYALYRKPATEHFKNVKLDRVTAEGAVESVTISPDGKYIAY